MRPTLLALALLAACGDHDDTSTDDTSSDDTSTDDTSSDDTSSDDTSDPCGESGICPLTATAAEVSCDAGVGPGLTVTSPAAGTVSGVDGDVQEGCCPTFEVQGEASQRTSTVSVTYLLTDDVCDCICSLDLTWTLTGVPAGAWTVVTPGGRSASVTVN